MKTHEMLKNKSEKETTQISAMNNNAFLEWNRIFETGGLAAYFKAYPTVKFINKTIITPQRPAPSASLVPIKETPKTSQFGTYGCHGCHFSSVEFNFKTCDKILSPYFVKCHDF